jgi:hypothetical protein
LQRQRHQALARRRRVRALADRLDDQVDLGRGHAEAEHDLALRLGLPQLEARAARHHVAAVVDEHLQRLLEESTLRLPIDDGEVDDAEALWSWVFL